jgi:hypothetical protein
LPHLRAIPVGLDNRPGLSGAANIVSERERVANEIIKENCLTIGIFGNDTTSMADARKHWNKICSLLGNSCHLITIADTGNLIHMPMDQNINLVKGLVPCLSQAFAHASVTEHEHHSIIRFNAAALRSLGVNSEVFASIPEARDWLKTQPHRLGCPYALK